MEACKLLGIFVERAGVQVCHSEERSDVGISCSSLRIRRSLPVIQPDTARLHPKGTSSRFALRAPRRFAPHNDTSGGAAVHQRPPAVELSRTWRSGSAATVKSVSTHVRRCPVHLGRPLLRLPRRLAPRNDKSGVITVLTGACTSRQRCAGSGMPLPYNSGCGRRNCFKICNCQWRSGSAATDAIGLYVFAGSLYELQVPAVFRLRILPPVRQRMRNRQNFGKFLCFFIMACYNESAE